ncbi:MAG TPA: universal stress protein [Conexibacter sp.]|nr:universal stress protein [Conexibacter sp.]
MRIGPVLIGYDGSEAAELAIVEAGALLPGRPALVLVVYKQGLGLELVQLPAVAAAGLPPATLDVRTAMEVDRETAEHARRLSREGAQVAAEAGFADPEGVAIADDVDTPVAETIANVARERHAQVVVVGGQGRSRAREVLLGTITRDVIRRAPCPVLVVRQGRPGHRLTAPDGAEQP